jgi:hypothetical protein
MATWGLLFSQKNPLYEWPPTVFATHNAKIHQKRKKNDTWFRVLKHNQVFFFSTSQLCDVVEVWILEVWTLDLSVM